MNTRTIESLHTGAELPSSGIIRAYVTVERVTDESAQHGDAAERGWTTRIGSSDIYDSRNDVAPLFEAAIGANGYITETCDIGGLFDSDVEAHESALDTLRDIVSSLGSIESDDGSTIYGTDAQTLDYSSPDTFNYAIHAHVKHYDGTRGWVETDVDILTLAGVNA